MQNLVAIEGFVTRRWHRDGNVFLRLAVYRDQDRPRKRPNDKRPGRWDAPDYISVKAPPELVAIVASLKKGQRVSVVGWLESVDYMESLRAFLKRAGVSVPTDLAEQADRIAVSRSSTWVVADRIVPIPIGEAQPPPEEEAEEGE